MHSLYQKLVGLHFRRFFSGHTAQLVKAVQKYYSNSYFIEQAPTDEEDSKKVFFKSI
jgi:hypothetical protein